MRKDIKPNKVMFYVGLGLAIAAAVLLIGNFMGNTSPIVLAIIGIGLIASSKVRLFK